MMKRSADGHFDEGKRCRFHDEAIKIGRGGGRIPEEEPTTPLEVKVSRKPTRGKSYSGFVISKSNYSYLLANIIPVTESKMMTNDILKELYKLESEVSNFTQMEVARIELQNQSNSTRVSILTWMSQCAAAMEWTVPSVYAAIATFDLYCATTKHFIRPEDLGRVAATCLYYAGHMQETAVDETIKPLDKLSSLCAEVGTPSMFLTHEIHLVDTLQGLNVSRKTPFDFLMLYLARLQYCTATFGEVTYEHMIKNHMLSLIVDVLHISTVYYYMSGLSLFIRGSIWIAVGLFHIITNEINAEPYLKDIGFEESTLAKHSPKSINRIKDNIINEILLATTHLAADGVEDATEVENILPDNDTKCYGEYHAIRDTTAKLYEMLLTCMGPRTSRWSMSNRLLNPMQYKKSQLLYERRTPYSVPIMKREAPRIAVGLTRPHSCWVHRHPQVSPSVETELLAEMTKLKTERQVRLESNLTRTPPFEEASTDHKRNSMSNGFVLPKPTRLLSCGAPLRNNGGR